MDDPLDDWFDDADCQDALLAAIVDAEQKANQAPPPPTKPTNSALPTPPPSTIPQSLPTQPRTIDPAPHRGQNLRTLPSSFASTGKPMKQTTLSFHNGNQDFQLAPSCPSSTTMLLGTRTSTLPSTKKSVNPPVPSPAPSTKLLRPNQKRLVSSAPSITNPMKLWSIPPSYTDTHGQSSTPTCPHPYDETTIHKWVYPINYPKRDYQFDIVQKALARNTLVALPTGLGKTFIAAVVMYNFYRWFPRGKILFMAPTKPLVTQQIKACYDICGIPPEDTVEMTGSLLPKARENAWQNKRVFFLTPQVIQNDIRRGTCPTSQVVCLVVDEAHRALGNHAYCVVVRELSLQNRHFRVLALSATPGQTLDVVCDVVTSLQIVAIELRTEESADVGKYLHRRSVDAIRVPLDDALRQARGLMVDILNHHVQILRGLGVHALPQNATQLNRYRVIMLQNEFCRKSHVNPHMKQNLGWALGNFGILTTLTHAMELLTQHSMNSCLNHLKKYREESLAPGKIVSRARRDLFNNPAFQRLVTDMERHLADTSRTSHPKLDKLMGILLEHFSQDRFHSTLPQTTSSDTLGEPTSDCTRVIVFSQYRESVEEITRLLSAHEPLIRVMSFVGQTSNKSGKGLSQKRQLEIIRQFKSGNYNTLVATCIGEEGLDIGEVDLIVCYDTQGSAIRLLQRMGRTGRKRQGRIVVLLSGDNEEQMFAKSQSAYVKVQQAIISGDAKIPYYRDNPRMLPLPVIPTCAEETLSIAPLPETPQKSKRHRQTNSEANPTLDNSSGAVLGRNIKRRRENKPDTLGHLDPVEWDQFHKNLGTLFDTTPFLGTFTLPDDNNNLSPTASPTTPFVLAPTRRLGNIMAHSAPWQTLVGHTHRIGHSLLTLKFVESNRCIDKYTLDASQHRVDTHRWTETGQLDSEVDTICTTPRHHLVPDKPHPPDSAERVAALTSPRTDNEILPDTILSPLDSEYPLDQISMDRELAPELINGKDAENDSHVVNIELLDSLEDLGSEVVLFAPEDFSEEPRSQTHDTEAAKHNPSEFTNGLQSPTSKVNDKAVVDPANSLATVRIVPKMDKVVRIHINSDDDTLVMSPLGEIRPHAPAIPTHKTKAEAASKVSDDLFADFQRENKRYLPFEDPHFAWLSNDAFLVPEIPPDIPVNMPSPLLSPVMNEVIKIEDCVESPSNLRQTTTDGALWEVPHLEGQPSMVDKKTPLWITDDEWDDEIRDCLDLLENLSDNHQATQNVPRSSIVSNGVCDTKSPCPHSPPTIKVAGLVTLTENTPISVDLTLSSDGDGTPLVVRPPRRKAHKNSLILSSQCTQPSPSKNGFMNRNSATSCQSDVEPTQDNSALVSDNGGSEFLSPLPIRHRALKRHFKHQPIQDSPTPNGSSNVDPNASLSHSQSSSPLVSPHTTPLRHTKRHRESRRAPTNRNNACRRFIDDEADLSGSDEPSDGSEEVDSQLEGFIDDEATPTPGTQTVDMQAIYRQSLFSPGSHLDSLSGVRNHGLPRFHTRPGQFGQGNRARFKLHHMPDVLPGMESTEYSEDDEESGSINSTPGNEDGLESSDASVAMVVDTPNSVSSTVHSEPSSDPISPEIIFSKRFQNPELGGSHVTRDRPISGVNPPLVRSSSARLLFTPDVNRSTAHLIDLVTSSPAAPVIHPLDKPRGVVSSPFCETPFSVSPTPITFPTKGVTSSSKRNTYAPEVSINEPVLPQGSRSEHGKAEQLPSSLVDNKELSPKPLSNNADNLTCPVVVIDARELTNPIASILRSRYQITSVVRSLAQGQYVISRQAGVKRKSRADVIQAASRNTLMDEILNFKAAFDVAILIIEQSPVDPLDSDNFSPVHTKQPSATTHRRKMTHVENPFGTRQFDQSIEVLTRMGLVVLFSFGHEETATLIYRLAEREGEQGACFLDPNSVPPVDDRRVRFLTTIPGVSDVVAWNLWDAGFKNLRDIINSDVDRLLTVVPFLSRPRANALYNYFRNTMIDATW
ncbi:3'-5' DNA helicase [Dispira simplex]|nr:3'-5' DNA helicase [Dispira simplex]